MSLSQAVPRALVAVCLAFNTTWSGAFAQTAPDFQPSVGQRGKDVIWVPTPQALVDRMLDAAKVTASDYVVDLGSGDGRTVITAAKRGAKALGIEYNPDMVELSKRNAEKAGVSDKATFMKADIFESDFSQATVITLFLLSGLNLKLRPIILNMKPGTRVASNTFDMGDWKADEVLQAGGDCNAYCRGFYWVVPAKTDGTWRLGESELKIEQKYQYFTGKLTTGNVVAPITDGKLNADQISFTAGGTAYTGWVKGGAMEGTAKSSGTDAKWQASKM